MTSLVYKTPFLYEAAMRVIFGRYYLARYEAIADLIDEGSSVLDVCCGPPVLYKQFLLKKSVKYTGLDLNERFIDELVRSGAYGSVADLQDVPRLPQADYVVMQASLYHFLPTPGDIVDRMLEAARKDVIISEPIRNWSSSRIPLVAWIARRGTNPGAGEHRLRFDEEQLDALFAAYAPRVKQSFLTPGGREKIYVLSGAVASA